MSKNCDGVEAKPKKSAASTVEAVDSAISDEGTKKKSSLETAFRGFVATPHVRLERYDITKYLNRHCRPVTHRKIQKNRTKNVAVHSERLSQRCIVSLQRDNLEKLKASIRSKTKSLLSDQSTDSDSEASEMTDMTVKCAICDKVYNSEKKLHKHQQKKHIIYKSKKTKTPKRVSFSDHVIVHEVKEYHKCHYFKPTVVLEKVEDLHPKPIAYVDVDTTEEIVNGNILKKALAGPKSKKALLAQHQFEVSSNPTQNDFVDVDITEGVIMIDTKGKPIVDPKSKKTLLSKHQCETCGKYFSSNYCLNRHISTQHEDFDKLRCNVCEETFYWPSLLRSHKCIRLNHPEMPFDDARAEILFDNMAQQGFDDFNIGESDDYMNSVDFEIPAPVVELRECDSTFMTNAAPVEYNIPDKNGVTSSGLQLIMQEVPIEF